MPATNSGDKHDNEGHDDIQPDVDGDENRNKPRHQQRTSAGGGRGAPRAGPAPNNARARRTAENGNYTMAPR